MSLDLFVCLIPTFLILGSHNSFSEMRVDEFVSDGIAKIQNSDLFDARYKALANAKENAVLLDVITPSVVRVNNIKLFLLYMYDFIGITFHLFTPVTPMDTFYLF